MIKMPILRKLFVFLLGEREPSSSYSILLNFWGLGLFFSQSDMIVLVFKLLLPGEADRNVQETPTPTPK